MPSTTEPCTWFTALSGLTIWRPTSAATHTLLTRTFFDASDADFRDFGKITGVTEVKSDALASAFRQTSFAPIRFCRNQFEHTTHSFRVERSAQPAGGRSRLTWRRRGQSNRRRVQDRVAKLNRIFARRMGQLVDERLHDERDAVAAGGAQCSGRHARGHHRNVDRKVRHKPRRKLGGVHSGAGVEPVARTETDEVIAPGDQFAGPIHAGL